MKFQRYVCILLLPISLFVGIFVFCFVSRKSYSNIQQHFFAKKYEFDTMNFTTTKIQKNPKIFYNHTFNPSQKNIKILLFFTTFPKNQHLTALQDCWPILLNQSKLLKSADIMVLMGGFLSKNELNAWKFVTKKIKSNASFQYQKLNPGYQEGAMKAMYDLNYNQWGRQYDWVIRLNPDVLIYDDSYFLPLIQSSTISAILGSCQYKKSENFSSFFFSNQSWIHTDFFAIRPHKLKQKDFSDWKTAKNAETQAKHIFLPLIKKGEVAWLQPKTANRKQGCRMLGNGVWHSHDSCKSLLINKPWNKFSTAKPFIPPMS